MEKIKSVFHSHRKSQDATHDAPHEPSATAEGQEHPIYDEMTNKEIKQQRKADQKGNEGRLTASGGPYSQTKTTSGEPYVNLAQPDSAVVQGHGRPQHLEGVVGGPEHETTDRTLDSTDPTSKHIGTDTTSSASAAGASTTAGQTLRPNANPTGHGSVNTDISGASIKSGVIGFGAHQSDHAAMPMQNQPEQSLNRDQVVGGGNLGTGEVRQGDAQPTFAAHDASTRDVISSTEPAPLDKSMRKESYITDTDRSFPLAGGVVHKKTQPVSNFDKDVPNPGHDREPGTKEKEVAAHDGHGREGLAGAAAAAAAATTGVAASRTLSRSQERDVKDQALETRQATYGDIPAAQTETVQPTTTTSAAPTSTSSSKHNPEALAAATAAATAASKSSHNAGFSPSERLNQNTTTTTAAPVLSRGLGDFGGARPHAHRTASRPHIPGEFPSPTPGDETKTFLDYRPVMDTTGDSTVTGAAAETSTAHPELRHTGTLEQPAAKEVESSNDHHYGRDAAIAGGVGAAGLGAYAATRGQSHEADNKLLYEEKSPYSSKALDPRVAGAGAATTSVDQQRFDPQTKTEASPHAQTSEPAGISTTSAPSASAPVQKDESDHHYGRDAALVGAGAATAAGATYALNNRDEPESRDFANPQTAPPTQAAPVTQAAPIIASEKRRESGPNTFYGTTGAPGPVADKSPRQKPVDEVQQTPAPVTSAVPERIPEEKSEPKSEHHYGRDAALVGGAGAAGLAAHEAAQRYDEHRSTQPSAAMDDQRYDPFAPGAHALNPVPAKAQYDYNDPKTTSNVNRSTIAPATGAGLAAGAAGGAAYAGIKGSENSRDLPAHDASTGEAQSAQSHQRYDSVNDPTQREDHTKRNAALAGTAGAATVGGAAYAYNEHSNREQERLAQQSEKEHARLEKRAEKEQHQHDKEAHKAEKEQQKHDKAAAKEERRRSKDSDENKEEKEKKGGLLGFLHRDKTRKEKKTGQSSNESSPRQSREVTPLAAGAGAGAGAAGLAAAHSSDEHMPQDMEASYASQGSGADSPRWKAKSKLHKDPPKNHPARQAWEEQQAGHVGAPEQYQHDPVHGIGGSGMSGAGGKTIEPHTGLPIDTSKGDGAGGIDGNPAVHGVHGNFEGREHQVDWEGVKKNDTVY